MEKERLLQGKFPVTDSDKPSGRFERVRVAFSGDTLKNHLAHQVRRLHNTVLKLRVYLTLPLLNWNIIVYFCNTWRSIQKQISLTQPSLAIYFLTWTPFSSKILLLVWESSLNNSLIIHSTFDIPIHLIICTALLNIQLYLN